MADLFRKINFYENLLTYRQDKQHDLTVGDIALDKICRSCLGEANDSENLFRKTRIINANHEKKLLLLVDIFKEVSGMEVDEFDALPHQICDRCIENASAAYLLKIQCQKAETLLVRMIASLINETTNNRDLIKDSIITGIKEENDHISPFAPENNYSLGNEEENKFLKTEHEQNSCNSNENLSSNDRIVQVQIKQELQEDEFEYTESNYPNSPEYESLENEPRQYFEVKKKQCVCPQCGKIFFKKKDLSDHAIAMHPGKNIFECDICHTRCSRINTLKRHKKIHQIDQQKLCPYCDKTFVRTDGLKRHIRSHMNGSLTNKKTSSRKFIKDSKITRVKEENEKNLTVNHENDHNLNHEVSKFLKIEYEQTSCNSNENVSSNVDQIEEVQIKQELEEDEIDIMETNCSNSSEFEPIETEKSYKLEKKHFDCLQCGKLFFSQKDLTDHEMAIHSGNTVFECDICHTRCSKINILNRHKKIHQSDQKNKVCPYCGKSFVRTDGLKRHIRVHTGEKPYACKLCPKRYKQTTELKDHMKTHSTDRAYVCTICGKTLLTRNGLYVHIKKHNGKFKRS